MSRNKNKNKNIKKNKVSNIYIRCIRGIPQVREVDNRHNTGDALQGFGVNPPSSKQYLYGKKKIVLENTEIEECFSTRTKNRLCLVNAYEKATQNNHLQELPRWCLYDPKRGIEPLRIETDEDGNKVICVVNECQTRRGLSNRSYDCYTDSKGNFWQTERRDLKSKPKGGIRKRLLVQQSCHAQEINFEAGCCNSMERRATEYQKRRQHLKQKTRYNCGKRPSGWRYY